MIIRSCAQRRTAWPLHSLSASNHVAIDRHFHASSAARAEMQNHYETLQVATSASKQEIKKSFYKLSKANHPDLHPNDPNASQRFVKISEAYSVLGSEEKKQKYDRDFFPQESASRGGGPAYSSPSGSHSSHQGTGPGGRPASGLSRRRTQFRGPPPSFYRNGGWGEHGHKRRENAEKASHTYEARGEAASGPQGPGMGPGGFSQGFDGDVSWFDQEGHLRTGESVESRARRKRTRKQGASFDDVGGGSMLSGFFLIGGILGAIAGVSGILLGGGGANAKGNKKASEA